jgi:hypothetical protein
MGPANAEVLRLRYKSFLADMGHIHGLLCASALKMAPSTKRQALAGERLHRSGCAPRGSLRRIWQNDANGRSLADHAFGFNPAAMQLHNMFDDG